MAGRIDLRLEVAERDLARMLRDFGERTVDDDIVAGMREAGDVAETKMVEITPERTGFLAGSTVVRTNDRRNRIETSITYGASYAAEVHELPRDARGPKTRAKGGNEFGPAGPKYIERVLRGFQIAPIIGERLRRAWRRAQQRAR